MAFWTMPLFVLGIAWNCLPGNRGAGRALFVWAPFGIALGTAWLVPRVFDLAPAGRWVFFGSLLLFTLFVAALAADLMTLRRLSRRTRPVASVARFYGFNKLAATLAAIIPLAASALTLWVQLQNGVLEQSTPTQTQDTRTASPEPSK